MTGFPRTPELRSAGTQKSPCAVVAARGATTRRPELPMARKTLARHRPTGTTHIYKSERADGSWAYEVRYRNARGERMYEVVGSGKGALARAKARAADLHASHALPAPVSTATTLADVIEAWRVDRAPRLKPRTVESYEEHITNRILPAFGRVRVRDITRIQIVRWLNGMKRIDGREGGLNDGTRAIALAVLKALLKHAVLMDVIAVAPVLPRGTAPRQGEGRKRILTREEEDQLVVAFGRREWMIPIMDVALGQALRLGEVCGLQWGDLDFAGKRVTVQHALGKDGKLGTPKGGKAATIQMTGRTRRALLELHLAQGRPADGYVFRNSYGGARQPRDVQRAFSEAVARAGLEDVCFHSLRHSGISRYANAAGMDIARAVAFARHSDAKVTLGYMHIVDDEAADAAAEEAI